MVFITNLEFLTLTSIQNLIILILSSLIHASYYFTGNLSATTVEQTPRNVMFGVNSHLGVYQLDIWANWDDSLVGFSADLQAVGFTNCEEYKGVGIFTLKLGTVPVRTNMTIIKNTLCGMYSVFR